MTGTRSFLSRSKITILDQSWLIYFQDAQQYERHAPENSRAFCTTRRRKIYFNCEATFTGDGVVRHELGHAYLAGLLAHDTGLSYQQFEELFCSFLEQRTLELIEKAKPLTKRLQFHAKRLKAKKAQEDDEEGDDD